VSTVSADNIPSNKTNIDIIYVAGKWTQLPPRATLKVNGRDNGVVFKKSTPEGARWQVTPNKVAYPETYLNEMQCITVLQEASELNELK
jgi:hypothetical protein